jgi:HAD superfamily hydrolase (TIGR01509 family)
MRPGVIFDMDGVLVDSEPLINRAAVAMFRERGHPEVTPDDFAPFVGGGEDRYIGGVAELHGIPLDVAEAKARTYAIYLDEMVHELLPFEGARELVERCRSTGAKVAVASATDWIRLEANLRQAGLPVEKWDAVVSGNDVTRKKPAPDTFLLAAERLGLTPPDCVVIEDSHNGVAAARAAGMRCVAVAQTFPSESLSDADVVRTAIADLTLDDLG